MSDEGSFEIVFRGYDRSAVDELVIAVRGAFSAPGSSMAAEVLRRLGEVRFTVMMRGYDRSQVDGYLENARLRLQRAGSFERRLVSSGSPLEPRIGFSRAVRCGPWVSVAGTAPIGADGTTVGPGNVYRQSVRCLDIAEAALREAGAALTDVVRTRMMLVDCDQWREAARAHGERFAEIRPACTVVQVSRFIDPEWLVEFELDAYVGEG